MALLISVCVLGGVVSCAEVTFKRGAGPDAMQATEQSCREKTADVDAYAGCLRAAGFIYAKPSDTAALFVAEEERAAAGESSAAIAEAAMTEAIPDPAAAAAAAANDSSSATPLISVEPAERAGASLPQSAKPKVKMNRDPLAEVTVASWWKLGGTAGGLEVDQGV